MELPHLGKQCSEPICNKLDFLPMKCDACSNIFCNEHYSYSKHNCPSAYKKDVQVPICPLCNALVPTPRGQLPDIAVGAHIDNDCQSDPAKNRRKAYVNKCSSKGCKIKEIVPVLCQECSLNFCLKHRHPADHKCEGKIGTQRRKIVEAAISRQNLQKSNNMIHSVKIQGNMSEDEALAKALALSMQETTSQLTQEESDQAIARALQEAENRSNAHQRQTIKNGDRCAVS